MSLLQSIINYANNLRASVLGREDGFYDVSGETTGLFHWPSFNEDNENTSAGTTNILILFLLYFFIFIILPISILLYKIYEIFLKPVYINTTQRGGKKNVKNKH